MNLLIPYVYHFDHNDPKLDEFTYGDDGIRSRKMEKDLDKGDYIFFHTSIRGKKYITAYYIVDRVLKTEIAANDKKITAKYENPHLLEFMEGKRPVENGDAIVFGDPITSRVLPRPLLFNQNLAKELSLGIKFPKGRTETQIIGSATRSWRRLTDDDVKIILHAIANTKPPPPDAILSTDEVMEILEKDIEGFIEKNQKIIGESLTLDKRQMDTPVGRIDLLFKDRDDDLTVVELKLNAIGNDAVNQLRRYMDWLRKETNKDVSGVIVCKGVMPAFKEEFVKLKNIKILCYGWQLKLYELRKNDK